MVIFTVVGVRVGALLPLRLIHHSHPALFPPRTLLQLTPTRWAAEPAACLPACLLAAVSEATPSQLPAHIP